MFAAWCDLRELVPYAFGYMMAAKVGTGIVAELGSMRISDEIDALEVMGIDSVLFLCATRLLAAWIVLPFVYIAAVGAGFFASYIAVVKQIGEVSSGGFFLIFWMFQNPPDLLYSLIKGMVMATAIVLVGCYYGYHAERRPGRRRHRDRQVDGPEHRPRAPDRHDGYAGVLGHESTSADRRLTVLLETLPTSPTAPATRAPARADLRNQIARLERDLAAYAPAPSRRGGAPRLLSLAELEAERDTLAADLSAARAAAADEGEAHAGARLLLEDMRANPERHRFTRLRPADLGERGCEYRVRPRRGLLGMLAGWWELTMSSGCPLSG